MYLSRSTTTLFLFLVGFVLFVAFENMPHEYLAYFGVAIGVISIVLMSGFVTLKLIAMYKSDMLDIAQKKPVKRITRPKE